MQKTRVRVLTGEPYFHIVRSILFLRVYVPGIRGREISINVHLKYTLNITLLAGYYSTCITTVVTYKYVLHGMRI